MPTCCAGWSRRRTRRCGKSATTLGHPLRAEFDRFVAGFVDKLRHSPDYREQVEGLKRDLLRAACLREVLRRALERFVAWLGTDVRAQQGIIRPGFETFLGDFAHRLQHDAALRARLNHSLAERASSITERYKQEVAAFVAAQVKSWDTQHAVRTIGAQHLEGPAVHPRERHAGGRAARSRDLHRHPAGAALKENQIMAPDGLSEQAAQQTLAANPLVGIGAATSSIRRNSC